MTAGDRLRVRQSCRGGDPQLQIHRFARLPGVEGEGRSCGFESRIGEDGEESGERGVEEFRQVCHVHFAGLDDRCRSSRDLDDGEFGERFFAQIGRF